jgi:hypothetical protein
MKKILINNNQNRVPTVEKKIDSFKNKVSTVEKKLTVSKTKFQRVDNNQSQSMLSPPVLVECQMFFFQTNKKY